MDIYVCVPIFNGYDLLNTALTSAENGTVKPTGYYVMNNGLEDYVHPDSIIANKTTVIRTGENLGCSKSWNWFIKNVPQLRIIINNDIEFFPDTIEKIVEGYITNQESAIIAPQYNAGVDETFSCFTMTDKVINEVGLFDEEFTPAYYEDSDYKYRCRLKNLPITLIQEAGYHHHHCATTHRFTPEQLQNHYNLTHKNSVRFVQKWGGLPGEEKFMTPFNS